MITVHTGPKTLQGFHLFNHLIPLGRGLILLNDKPGFSMLLRKLNQPTYERLSGLLEAFTAARYAAAGYDVELEPKTADRRSPDFRVRLHAEWIYFECKRINVEHNESVRKNREFIMMLENDFSAKFRGKIPNGYRIDIRLDTKPNSAQIQTLASDLERMIHSGTYEVWFEQDYGKYALVPRADFEKARGYPTRSMQITVGTTLTPISASVAEVTISFNPFGSKIEQRFRSVLKESKRQIPSKSRGILIIQGLDEAKAMSVLQERLGRPDYHNIIAGVAIGNGVYAVPRDDHSDVDYDFIGKCVSCSLFHDYDVGNY